jgi:hypothetical protein
MAIPGIDDESLNQAARWLDTVINTFQAAVRSLPDTLANLQPWQAALLIPLGLVSLLYGLKLFRGMVVIYAAMVGVLVGYVVAEQVGLNPIVGVVVGGLVLGAVSWPLLKGAAVVLGGLAGALLAVVVVYAWGGEAPYLVVGAGVGFLIGLVLAVLLFRALIIFMTAVLGAHLVALGVVALVSLAPAVNEAVISGLEARRWLLPVLIGVPAAIGAIYQARLMEAEEKKDES